MPKKVQLPQIRIGFKVVQVKSPNIYHRYIKNMIYEYNKSQNFKRSN